MNLMREPAIFRREDFSKYLPKGSRAVELGVATGAFSEALLSESENIRLLVSVDKWNDHHDDAEMKQAMIRLGKYGTRSLVMRSLFSEAVTSFEDGYFDFIYIDGYAHTGQEGGRTLDEWWPKLKVGGIFAGHDYDPQWPLVVMAVTEFSLKYELPLNFTWELPAKGQGFASWWVRKPAPAVKSP